MLLSLPKMAPGGHLTGRLHLKLGQTQLHSLEKKWDDTPCHSISGIAVQFCEVLGEEAP